MNSEQEIQSHLFNYGGEYVELVFSIESAESGKQLVLLDALGQSDEHIASVPDSIIEFQACEAAESRGARYT